MKYLIYLKNLKKMPLKEDNQHYKFHKKLMNSKVD
jgi:hypothetical protein